MNLNYINKLKISKFLIVGSLGSVTNIVIFYFLVDVRSYDPIIVSILSFFIASLQNYTLNHYWTFLGLSNDNHISFKSYVKYVMITLIGLIINLIVLKLILFYYNPGLKVIAQLLGIISGTATNYLGAKHWVFNAKH